MKLIDMITSLNNLSQEELNTAIRVFQEHNASTIIAGCFWKWIVNDHGDLFFLDKECLHYFLYRERLEQWDQEELYKQISSKTWFQNRQPKIGQTFLEALSLVRQIISHKAE